MPGFDSTLDSIVRANREPDWLRDLRRAALSRFDQTPVPAKNDEHWRRVDLAKFLTDGLDFSAEASSDSVFEPSPSGLPARDPQSELQWSSASGAWIGTLARAAREKADLVRPLLENSLARHPGKFHALVSALWNGGLFIHVPDNARVELPISAVLRAFHGRKAGGPRPGLLPRTLIVLGKNSRATFVLDEQGSDALEGWITGLTETYLQAGASLSLLQVQRYGRRSTALSSFYAELDRDASLNLMTVQSGSALSKSDWDIRIKGEGASAKVFGLVRGEGTQHFDETLFVGHEQPRGSSEVIFKTVAKDKSRSIFTGLIHVAKAAQKTNAYQTNRNLLLSRDARADAIPKLEIEADDVKCGHGAAVSNIDPDQLFYLMCRGLSRADAEALIIAGFYEDVLDRWLEASPFSDASKEQERGELIQWVNGILVGTSEPLPVSV